MRVPFRFSVAPCDGRLRLRAIVIVDSTRQRTDVRTEGEALFMRNAPVGVKLSSDLTPELIGSDLDRLSLVRNFASNPSDRYVSRRKSSVRRA